MPNDKTDMLATKRFEILADGVCDACVLMFWENARPDEARSAEWTARQMRKCEGGLAEISPCRAAGTFTTNRICAAPCAGIASGSPRTSSAPW